MMELLLHYIGIDPRGVRNSDPGRSMGSISKQRPTLLFPALCDLALDQSEEAWDQIGNIFLRDQQST